MTETSIYVIEATTAEGIKHYVTPLPPDVVFANGLIAEAIVGVLLHPVGSDKEITPEVFARNSLFVKFMHEVIAMDAPHQSECVAEAERVRDGWIYIVDRRTKTPQGQVPPEDIVGVLQATNGKVVPGSYQPSPKHAILTKDGFFRLTPGLHQCLLRALESRQRAG